MDMSFLDPSRTIETEYMLVLRSDHKLCPKQVKRCQYCRRDFLSKDLLVIKTFGDRGEFENERGQLVPTEGNIYVHFLTKCLTEYDGKFLFSEVVVPDRTRQKIPASWKPLLISSGIKI